MGYPDWVIERGLEDTDWVQDRWGDDDDDDDDDDWCDYDDGSDGQNVPRRALPARDEAMLDVGYKVTLTSMANRFAKDGGEYVYDAWRGICMPVWSGDGDEGTTRNPINRLAVSRMLEAVISHPKHVALAKDLSPKRLRMCVPNGIRYVLVFGKSGWSSSWEAFGAARIKGVARHDDVTTIESACLSVARRRLLGVKNELRNVVMSDYLCSGDLRDNPTLYDKKPFSLDSVPVAESELYQNDHEKKKDGWFSSSNSTNVHDADGSVAYFTDDGRFADTIAKSLDDVDDMLIETVANASGVNPDDVRMLLFESEDASDATDTVNAGLADPSLLPMTSAVRRLDETVGCIVNAYDKARTDWDTGRSWQLGYAKNGDYHRELTVVARPDVRRLVDAHLRMIGYESPIMSHVIGDSGVGVITTKVQHTQLPYRMRIEGAQGTASDPRRTHAAMREATRHTCSRPCCKASRGQTDGQAVIVLLTTCRRPPCRPARRRTADQSRTAPRPQRQWRRPRCQRTQTGCRAGPRSQERQTRRRVPCRQRRRA